MNYAFWFQQELPDFSRIEMLIDIDNDGIRDFISIIEEDAACKLLWRKGLLGGEFEAESRNISVIYDAQKRDENTKFGPKTSPLSLVTVLKPDCLQ